MNDDLFNFNLNIVPTTFDIACNSELWLGHYSVMVYMYILNKKAIMRRINSAGVNIHISKKIQQIIYVYIQHHKSNDVYIKNQ